MYTRLDAIIKAASGSDKFFYSFFITIHHSDRSHECKYYKDDCKHLIQDIFFMLATLRRLYCIQSTKEVETRKLLTRLLYYLVLNKYVYIFKRF